MIIVLTKNRFQARSYKISRSPVTSNANLYKLKFTPDQQNEFGEISGEGKRFVQHICISLNRNLEFIENGTIVPILYDRNGCHVFPSTSGHYTSETAESHRHFVSEATNALIRANKKRWEVIRVTMAIQENLNSTRNLLSFASSIQNLTLLVADADRDFQVAKTMSSVERFEEQEIQDLQEFIKRDIESIGQMHVELSKWNQ